MGHKLTTSPYYPKDKDECKIKSKIIFNLVSRNRFEFLYIIGRGGFGRVWKVIDKKTGKEYALKEMKKVKVIDKKSEISILYERELLSRLNSPFIVNMYLCFQDHENLYLLMDLLSGGDLRYHICRYRKFTEEQSQFFIACIILGLDFIHSNKIIHRDIKPENLVLDENGYIRITDFGIAKVYNKENKHETSGTPGYMAPEVIRCMNHNYAVDYFAVGVIGYEFMTGRVKYI
ncbi:MAG: protein kinase [archaeon]|nr:protein kinase [archaeon]